MSSSYAPGGENVKSAGCKVVSLRFDKLLLCACEVCEYAMCIVSSASLKEEPLERGVEFTPDNVLPCEFCLDRFEEFEPRLALLSLILGLSSTGDVLAEGVLVGIFGGVLNSFETEGLDALSLRPV